MLSKPKYAPVKEIYGNTVDYLLGRISDKLHAGESTAEVEKWIVNAANRLEPREHRRLLIDACNYWAQLVAPGIPKTPQPEQTTLKT